ncbi:MAG: hypothetical protein Q9165_002420 [Trypethelium subeluteriae]
MSSSKEASPPPLLKIAIIGAGPAGCTLGLLLHQSRLPLHITIFELDSSLSSRGQGGTLDLHKDTGLRAIRALGLWTEFVALARLDGDSIQLYDWKKVRYLNVKSSARKTAVLRQGKPEIDRRELRELLVGSLPEGMVKWGCKFLGLKEESGNHELSFEHGFEKDFDLVVGADGAFSKVRPVLMKQEVCFSKIGGFTMAIPHAEERNPKAYKLVRRGSVFAFAQGKELIGQQMGDGSVSVTVWLRKDDERWMTTCGFDVRDGDAVLEDLKRELMGWHPKLTTLLEGVDPSTVEARSLFQLPVGARWESKRGITMIGDAAHLMTPFIGEGVNAGMRDAHDLANCIIDSLRRNATRKDILDAIAAAEQEMMKRVAKVQLRTDNMKDLMLFTEGAPRTVIEKYIIRALSDDLNRVSLASVKLLVNTYFAIFKIIKK